MGDTPLKPGEVRLISLEVLPDSEELIPNGQFEEWLGGLGYPTDFTSPTLNEFSTIKRESRGDFDEVRGYVAEQVWFENDSIVHPANQFGTTVTLYENTTYTFTAWAEVTEPVSAVVQAWDTSAIEFPRLLSKSVVEIGEPGIHKVTGQFRNGNHEHVKFASYLKGRKQTAGKVRWYGWGLNRNDNEEVHEGSVPAPTPFLTTAIDQLAKQSEIYGGYGEWSQKLRPIREAFRELSSTIKGSDPIATDSGFVFRPADLLFFESSENLLFDQVSENSFVRNPFFDELLRTSEVLDEMGIGFVCVPLPTRVHTYPERIIESENSVPTGVGYFNLVHSLLEFGCTTVDVSGALGALKTSSKPIYFENSLILSGLAHREVGVEIAKSIAQIRPEYTNSFRSSYSTDTAETEVSPLLTEFEIDGEKRIPPMQQQSLIRVVGKSKKPIQLGPTGEILAVGRIAHDYKHYSASWAFHLAGALGTSVGLYDGPYRDEVVLRHLLEEKDLLASVKVVVFCFSESKLLAKSVVDDTSDNHAPR